MIVNPTNATGRAYQLSNIEAAAASAKLAKKNI